MHSFYCVMLEFISKMFFCDKFPSCILASTSIVQLSVIQKKVTKKGSFFYGNSPIYRNFYPFNFCLARIDCFVYHRSEIIDGLLANA